MAFLYAQQNEVLGGVVRSTREAIGRQLAGAKIARWWMDSTPGTASDSVSTSTSSSDSQVLLFSSQSLLEDSGVAVSDYEYGNGGGGSKRVISRKRPRSSSERTANTITFEDDVLLPFKKRSKKTATTTSSSSSSSATNPLLPTNATKTGNATIGSTATVTSTSPVRSYYSHIAPPRTANDGVVVPATPATPASADGSSAVVAAATGVGGGRGGAPPDEWQAYAISEDYEVFRKTGINPRERDLSRRGKCYACGLHGGGGMVPTKRKNVETFFRRMEEASSDIPDALARSELLESDYRRLIQDPKKRLKMLLEGRRDDKKPDEETVTVVVSQSTTGVKAHCDHHHHHHHHHSPENEDVGDADGEDEPWDKVDIYNHLVRHTNNVVEDISYMRRSAFNQIKMIEDNSLVQAHPTKKNKFGEPLLMVNESQARCYQALVRSYMDLSKSRPDLMAPFYDGRRTPTPRQSSSSATGASAFGASDATEHSITNNDSGGGGNARKQQASAADFGGHLLYGKGL